MWTRQEISVEDVHEAVGPYADAVRFGSLLFISGCGGRDRNYQMVDSDVVGQARQAFINMQKILEAAGLGLSDVLKVTVYLTDRTDLARIVPVRKQFFGNALPASTALQVASLSQPDMKIEIDAIAGFSDSSNGSEQ